MALHRIYAAHRVSTSSRRGSPPAGARSKSRGSRVRGRRPSRIRRRRLRAGALGSSAGPSGVASRTLAAALATQAPRWNRISRVMRRSSASVFAALNTAHLRDGAVVIVPERRRLRAPVHLLFIATQPRPLQYPRCLRGCGSRQPSDGRRGLRRRSAGDAYFTNAVTEIAVGPNARMRPHADTARKRPAFHIATCAVSLGKDASRYRSVRRSGSGRGSRGYDLNVLQTGEGAAVQIDGLALIGQRQLADTHTLHRSRETATASAANCTRRSSATRRTRFSTARSSCARAHS